MQSGFSNIDARLLQLIQAVNNSSSSGGGTSAIVGALKDLQNDIVDFRADRKNLPSEIYREKNYFPSLILDCGLYPRFFPRSD